MLDLGALKASIKLDDKEAVEGMKEFGNTTDKTEGKLKAFASKVGGMAKTAMIGLTGAVVGAGTAMIGTASKALEATATIDKFSATCNVSTDEFQRLDGVMKQMGWSMENAAGDFAMLSEKMYEASTTGEGEAYEMFQKLGVAVEDSSGKLRNTGDVFNDMILSLQNVEDATERQAMASIMLGTTSEELAPLLQMTNEEFINMKDNVNIIDEKQLNQAKEFKNSWDSLKQTFETVVIELGIALMPMFQSLANWINEHMPQIQTVIEIVFGVVTEVIDGVVGAIDTLISWFENLVANNDEVSTELKAIWDVVKDMFSTLFKEIGELVKAFVDWCSDFWARYGDEIIAVVKSMWEVIENIFKTTFNILIEVINFFTSLFKGDWQGMKDAIINIVSIMWEGVKELFINSLDYLANLGSYLFNIGVDLFTFLWDGIKSVWNKLCNWVEDKVDWLMDKLTFWKKTGNEMATYETLQNRSSERYINLPTNINRTIEMMPTRTQNTLTTFQPVFNIYSNTGDGKEISRLIQKDLINFNRAQGIL